MKTAVGIIGYGFVGRAVGTFENIVEVNVYDVALEEFNSTESKKKAYNSDIIFVNVPTDLNSDERLDASIIYECMRDYKLENTKWNTIVIKSTIPVGFCDELKSFFGLDNIVFNPEFLTQRTAIQDFMFQKEIYLAGNWRHTSRVKSLYREYFDFYKNKEYQFFETQDYKEYELLKLSRNTFYGIKVSYCNYIYNLCEKLDIDYDSFKEHFARGEWVGKQHTMVPGPDGKFGYGGKCLSKDSIELLNYSKKQGIMFDMLKESINFNIHQRNK